MKKLAILMLVLFCIGSVYAYDLDKYEHKYNYEKYGSKEVYNYNRSRQYTQVKERDYSQQYTQGETYQKPSSRKKEVTNVPNILGAGVLIYDTPYAGEDTRVTGVPVVWWQGEHFFARGLKAGAIIGKTDEYEYNVFARPRLLGYDSSDSDALSGMEDRDWSLDMGVGMVYRPQSIKGAELDFGFSHDILNEHEGYDFKVTASKLFDLTPLFIKPSVGVEWQSEELVDYYYGVRPSEARVNRPQYTGNSAFNYLASCDFYLALSEEWLIVSSVGVWFLDKEIRKSPIVDENQTITGIVGITRMF
jgi:outer membrane protein